jgi:GDPmannose 4,6-dehydratase
MGITGQDGSYLAELLLAKGYEVHGVIRRASTFNTARIDHLYTDPHSPDTKLFLHYGDLSDGARLVTLLAEVAPDEVYNLAGQTSVGLSFNQPVETFESIVIGTVNLLEAIRMLDRPIRLYNAGSSEMFGNTGEQLAGETTVLRPCSPYGIAKATSFWQIAQYRQAYKIEACTGILFNHESPLRPERFVTQKIVAGACRVAAGEQDVLSLGDLSVRRDWGWAPEYVVAMHRMLQLDTLEDFVIATGQTTSLEDFVCEVFASLGLDWRKHVVRDPARTRPSDAMVA